MIVFAPVFPTILEKDRALIITHLSSLSREDRYFRFGTAISDEQIKRYVKSIKAADMVVCAFDSLNPTMPVGVMHVAICGAGDTLSAEIGSSVLVEYRKRGIGENLFSRAITKCQNLKVAHMYTFCVPSNIPVQKMIKKIGFDIRRDFDQQTGELTLTDPNLFSVYRGALFFEQELIGTMFANVGRLMQTTNKGA